MPRIPFSKKLLLSFLMGQGASMYHDHLRVMCDLPYVLAFLRAHSYKTMKLKLASDNFTKKKGGGGNKQMTVH